MLSDFESIHHLSVGGCSPQTHAPLSSEHSHAHHSHEPHDLHHHHHVHTTHRPRQRRALWISLWLTATMMVVEFVTGWITGSLMLVSDAAHMLSHAAALGVSLTAIILARKQLGEHFSYGLYRIEVLAALVNGLGLAGLSLWIVYEAILRIINPVAVASRELIIVAVLGLLINAVTAAILIRAGHEDLNTRSAVLHLVADGFSSVVVVIGALVLAYTGWAFIDPVLSIIVALIVGHWSISLLRDASLILLERKPAHLNLQEIETTLMTEFSTIKNIHDLHVWEITTHFHCLSAHVVLEDVRLSETAPLRHAIASHLRHRFGIGHTVIQFEAH